MVHKMSIWGDSMNMGPRHGHSMLWSTELKNSVLRSLLQFSLNFTKLHPGPTCNSLFLQSTLRSYCHLDFSLRRCLFSLKREYQQAHHLYLWAVFLFLKLPEVRIMERRDHDKNDYYFSNSRQSTGLWSVFTGTIFQSKRKKINTFRVWSWILSTVASPICNSIEHFPTQVVRKELLFWLKLCVVLFL